MNVDYEFFKNFMESYFKDYSQYAQDAETISKMDKYWTEDILVTAYFQLQGGEYPLQFTNRKDWKDFLVEGHLTIWENLMPIDLMYDTVQLKSTSILKVEKYDRKTDEQLCNLDGIGYYKLVKEDDSIKIKSLDFFTGDPGSFSKLYKLN
jgi:hypothetical protein